MYLFAGVKDFPPVLCLGTTWPNKPFKLSVTVQDKTLTHPKPVQRDPAGLGCPCPISHRRYLYLYTANTHLSSSAQTQTCCFIPLPDSRKECFPIPPLFPWPRDTLSFHHPFGNANIEQKRRWAGAHKAPV